MPELKELEHLLKEGKITRREFISQASVLGLMASFSPSLLITQAEAAKPKKGGRLRIGSSGNSMMDSLDPRLLTDIMPQVVNQCLRNNLCEINYKGFLIPELAKSWEASPDASK